MSRHRKKKSKSLKRNIKGFGPKLQRDLTREAWVLEQSTRVKQQLALGVEYIRSGELLGAEACFKQILQWQPDNADAWHLFGVMAVQHKQYTSATEKISHAIELNPKNPNFYNSLSKAYLYQQKCSEASACCEKAIQLKSDYVNAYINLGMALKAQGKLNEAATSYKQALQIRPDLYQVHIHLGNVYREQGEIEEAIASFQRTLQLWPDCQQAHYNLGNAWELQGKLEEAIAAYQRALQLQPNLPKAHTNLGNVYTQQGKLDEAVRSHQQALQLQPTYAGAHNNLGNTLKEQGKIEEAIGAYQQAIQSQFDFPEAHFNLGAGLLLAGDVSRGWEEYEWRFERKDAAKKPISTPMWQGQPLKDKPILLWSEQGLGDSIQFVRYALLLQQQVAKITIATEPPLMRLFDAGLAAPVAVIDQDEVDLSSYETHASLMSLPRILQTTWETLPAPISYIQAPQIIPESLKLPNSQDYKVGIVWASSRLATSQLYQKKSITADLFLSNFKDFLASGKVSLWSLQVGEDAPQIQPYLQDGRVHDLSPRLQDFLDTACAIAQLDLVITVDTAVAHLAGAMGKPVWVLLPFVPDWRWLLERQDTPWYPSMRLFRQPALGDWDSIFARVKEDLQTILTEKIPASKLDRTTPDECKFESTTNELQESKIQPLKMLDLEQCCRNM